MTFDEWLKGKCMAAHISYTREIKPSKDVFLNDSDWSFVANLLQDCWLAALESREELESRLLKSLTTMYYKWENGISCQEAGEDGGLVEGTSIGNAFKLSFEEEQEILNLIVDKSEPHERACFNCGKPYRAHLLDHENKCSPNSANGWLAPPTTPSTEETNR